ncbi:hypothetical protein EK21DRAFT_52001, partial [Setomelanomma holmii]
LQKEMLANVDKVQAVSDQQFEHSFRALASSIKSLSRLLQLTGKFDIGEVLGVPLLLQDMSIELLRGRIRKKCFIEVYLWSTLLDMVFRDPFKVFGPHFDAQSDVWKDIFGSDFFPDWPKPTTRSETWRYTVAEQVSQIVGVDLITEGKLKKKTGQDQEVRQDMDQSVLEVRIFVATSIESGLAMIASAMDSSLIQDVVDKAFTLALHMSLQRARFQITYPALGARFVKEEMKCDSDGDGDEMSNGKVAVVINPGLTKWGDALGKNLEYRYDIVPSFVQLEATDGVSLI